MASRDTWTLIIRLCLLAACILFITVMLTKTTACDKSKCQDMVTIETEIENETYKCRCKKGSVYAN